MTSRTESNRPVGCEHQSKNVDEVRPTCTGCGNPIDQHAIDCKAHIMARLHPGLPVTPPKRCTRCVWDVLTQMEDE